MIITNKIIGWICDCCEIYSEDIHVHDFLQKRAIVCKTCFNFLKYFTKPHEYTINYHEKIKKLDKWRENYHKMTFKDCKAFAKSASTRMYNYRYYFNIRPICQFFIDHSNINLDVMELGGGNGKLANILLNAFDQEHIISWLNYEIVECEPKLKTHKDYKEIILDRYLWDTNIVETYCNTFVSIHTIEHLSLDQFEKLINWIPDQIKYMYFEIPIKDEGQTWTGEYSSHILKSGWNKLNEIIKKKGFTIKKYNDTCYGYIR